VLLGPLYLLRGRAARGSSRLPPSRVIRWRASSSLAVRRLSNALLLLAAGDQRLPSVKTDAQGQSEPT